MKKNSPVKDPWHSWHMPKKESGTEVAAVAQWQDQQPLLCSLASAVEAEPHLAELKLLVCCRGRQHNHCSDR